MFSTKGQYDMLMALGRSKFVVLIFPTTQAEMFYLSVQCSTNLQEHLRKNLIDGKDPLVSINNENVEHTKNNPENAFKYNTIRKLF